MDKNKSGSTITNKKHPLNCVTKQFTLFVHKANFDLFWVGELDKANAIKLGQNEAEMVGKRRQKMNN